jgi:hypothetical protein
MAEMGRRRPHDTLVRQLPWPAERGPQMPMAITALGLPLTVTVRNRQSMDSQLDAAVAISGCFRP